jgi:hypothetical protein
MTHKFFIFHTIILGEKADILLSREKSGYRVFMSIDKFCDGWNMSTYFKNQTDINLLKENRVGPDEIIIQVTQ